MDSCRRSIGTLARPLIEREVWELQCVRSIAFVLKKARREDLAGWFRCENVPELAPGAVL
ncbi:MAG: hypothetical protein RLZZ458_2840 [Planctomycetota bacterium]|jgi:hypothetical protein